MDSGNEPERTHTEREYEPTPQRHRELREMQRSERETEELREEIVEESKFSEYVEYDSGTGNYRFTYQLDMREMPQLFADRRAKEVRNHSTPAEVVEQNGRNYVMFKAGTRDERVARAIGQFIWSVKEA